MHKYKKVIFQQLIYWLIVIIVISGYEHREIRKLFQLEFSSNSLIDLGMLVFFVLTFLSINQSVIYENIDDFVNNKTDLIVIKRMKSFKLNNKHWFFKKNLGYKDFKIQNQSSSFRLSLFYAFNLYFGFYIVSLNAESSNDFINIPYYFLSLFWLRNLILTTVLYIKTNTLFFTAIRFREKVSSFIITILIIYIQFFDVLKNFVTGSGSSIMIELSLYSFQLVLIIFVMINPIILFFTYIIYNIKNIATREYTIAYIRKEQEENKVIMNYLFNPKELYMYRSESDINYYLLKNSGSLTESKNLLTFLEYISKKQDISEFNKLISNCVLPVEQMKDARANYISNRNKDNLYIAAWTLIVFLIAYLITKSLVVVWEVLPLSIFQNFLDLMFVLIFIRLLMRSVEICYSFYTDLHDKEIDKKSNLTKRNRANLALNSLIEIIFFSYLTTLCLIGTKIEIENTSFIPFIVGEILNLVNLFMYSLSVSLFNVSFENLQDVISSHIALIRPIHLTQVISSVVLLTICLTSYINSQSSYTTVLLKKRDGNYICLEQTNSGIKRNIFKKEFETIDLLVQEVNFLYETNCIDGKTHEMYRKAINRYKIRDIK